jgi:alkylation response protein AidB-like acyl-CoA dehydrogenase
VKERNAFGRPIATFQNTQFKLAEMDTELTAAEVFTDRCLELLVGASWTRSRRPRAKLLGSEVQCRIIDECVQLHGGYGYMWEYPVARAFADARVQRIYGGTSEVMKLIIGRALTAD